jgi:predicted nuclease of predicted toxin-antitoxin system
MPRTIRFHLDENASGAVAEGLRRLGIDVTTTPQVTLLGVTDEELLAHSLGEGRVLLTHDRDLLSLHAAGVPHAGIAYCRKDARTIGEIVQALTLIWEVYDPPEMADRIEYL